MKQIGEELLGKATELNKDNFDLKTLMSRYAKAVGTFRDDHPATAGAMEAAIGVTAIAVGATLFEPIEFSSKVPELIGSITGAGVGGTVGALVASTIGGIGIVAMGTGFGIPAAAVTALGAASGALPGSIAGWFGGSIAEHSTSLTEAIFMDISGAALVAFGCYMLFLALKDLWKAGGEFIAYLKSIGIQEKIEEGDPA